MRSYKSKIKKLKVVNKNQCPEQSSSIEAIKNCYGLNYRANLQNSKIL